MSAHQQAGKKNKAKVKPKVEKEKSVTLDEVFSDKPVEVKRPEPEPKAVKAEATVKEPVIVVNVEKILRWAARLKTGGFGAWGNGANFANHMIRDSFSVDGEQPSIEEASQLIAVHTNVTPKDPWA